MGGAEDALGGVSCEATFGKLIFQVQMLGRSMPRRTADPSKIWRFVGRFCAGRNLALKRIVVSGLKASFSSLAANLSKPGLSFPTDFR